MFLKVGSILTERFDALYNDVAKQVPNKLTFQTSIYWSHDFFAVLWNQCYILITFVLRNTNYVFFLVMRSLCIYIALKAMYIWLTASAYVYVFKSCYGGLCSIPVQRINTRIHTARCCSIDKMRVHNTTCSCSKYNCWQQRYLTRQLLYVLLYHLIRKYLKIWLQL